ncbi:MAG: prepilin-type N-terminal cleavage/methylation domain-containing protein [Deltaproteobacteria bacterium]|nr:prepilin-type N-terminal cleavage/methylation domain-containing protein [Deltaproteobacteria bacterium]
MSSSTCNSEVPGSTLLGSAVFHRPARGISLIESLIAILIVSIGLVGLLSMQPSAWRASARADYLGHAAVILSRELTQQELWVMNPCNAVSLTPVSRVVNASGQAAAQSGDTRFTVQTTTTNLGGSVWRITVRVSWPPLNATGITESVVVTRQEPFRFPLGCI